MSEPKQRPGVMLYFNEWAAPLALMNGEQIKELLSHVINLARDGEYPNGITDPMIQVFFQQVSPSVIRDGIKYQEMCEKRSRAGKASANKRQQVSTPANTCQLTRTEHEPNDNKNIKRIVIEPEEEKEFYIESKLTRTDSECEQDYNAPPPPVSAEELPF